MNDQNDSWIDTALQELAAADARAVVPPELEGAVLRAWDAQRAAVDTGGFAAIRFMRGWRKAAAFVLMPTAVVGVVAVVSLARRPAPTLDRQVPTIHAAVPSDVSVLAPVRPARIMEAGVTSPTVRRLAGTGRRVPVSGEYAGEYVIVPEPFADPTMLQVVRVRMARTALATLGVPIVDPDAEGLVNVEMLVGEDGVARSIRNATVESENTDQGAER
jgi:hypothetical protein